MSLYLIWNSNRTECVGFTDKSDAYEAAGIYPLRNGCATLANEWRQMYADDELGDQPDDGQRVIFDIQEVKL